MIAVLLLTHSRAKPIGRTVDALPNVFSRLQARARRYVFCRQNQAEQTRRRLCAS